MRTLSRPLIGLGILATLAFTSGHAADKPMTPHQSFSYTLGYELGEKLKAQNLEVDGDAFAKAIGDVMTGRKPLLDAKQREAAIKAAQAEELKKQEAMSASNAKAGDEYMAAFDKEPGSKALDSGVHYQIIKAGKGDSPAKDASVVVHYRGTKTDGTEFDSSHKRGEPATFPVNRVIPGFSDALTHMKPGGHWKVVIPGKLAYGERGIPGKIGPNETLIFDLQLLEIKK